MQERILVVVDEEVLRNLANEVLSEEGYLVSLASSGQEALEVMKQKEFDLVIADFKMPPADFFLESYDRSLIFRSGRFLVSDQTIGTRTGCDSHAQRLTEDDDA